MTRQLDLADIQGNILEDFVRNFPAARFIFLQITDAAAGRAFILEYRAKVTTALRWGKSDSYVGESLAQKPQVAINIALTFPGFLALGLPTRTLAKMPAEFIDGMKARAEILGDDVGANVSTRWDSVWNDRPHIAIGLNALLQDATGAPVPELEQETLALQQLCEKHKLKIMSGHRNPANPAWQDASAILVENEATYKPVPKEHFGFVDGISNPVFEGQFGDAHVEQVMAVGNGKIMENGDWASLATGEFLLGHPDEAQETAPAGTPPEVMRNGTFLVYRKLHENVASFDAYIDTMAQSYAALMKVTKRGCAQHPQGQDGRTLARWRTAVGRAHHRRVESLQRPACGLDQEWRQQAGRLQIWRRSGRHQMSGHGAFAAHQHARWSGAKRDILGVEQSPPHFAARPALRFFKRGGRQGGQQGAWHYLSRNVCELAAPI